MDLGNTWSVMSTDSGKEKASLIVGWRAVGTHLNKPVFTIYIHKSRYSQHVFDDAEADYVILCKKIAQTEEDISTIDHADPMYSWLEKEGSHHIYDGQILQVMKNTEIHP